MAGGAVLYLLELDLSPTVYYVSSRFAMTIGGTAYEARQMALKSIGWDASELSIDDDGTLLTELYAHNLTGTAAVLSRYRLTEGGGAGASMTVINGGIERAWADEAGAISLRIASDVGLHQNAIVQRGAVSCTFRFKGTYCAYAGADTSCDHTLADCVSKSNINRFGGFTTALEIGEQFILSSGGFARVGPGDRGVVVDDSGMPGDGRAPIRPPVRARGYARPVMRDTQIDPFGGITGGIVPSEF